MSIGDQKVLSEDQLLGVDFLKSTPRCILADAVGTGKTAQALTAIHQLDLRKVLYVTGTQASYQVEDEVDLWAPMHTVKVLKAARKIRYSVYANRPDILVISYEVFRNDVKILKTLTWDLVVLDDASKFKNPQSNLSKAAFQFSPLIGRAWAMTATPIENNLQDLWSIFKSIGLMPLGSNPELPDFMTWTYEQRSNYSIKKPKSYMNLDIAITRIKPYILRRDNILGPEVKLINHYVGLYPEQLRIYKTLRRKRADINTVFHKVMMACDTTEFTQIPGVSTKIDFILNFLNKTQPDKMVVYSRWKVVLRHLKRELAANGISFAEISGDIPVPMRAEAQRRFHTDLGPRVMLVTSAGEQGLNLQAAKYLICINRIANPQRMAQVRGRIIRRSSKYKKVFIIDLIVKNSIEEKMFTLMQSREEIFDTVFGTTPKTRSVSSDLREILYADLLTEPELTNKGQV